MGHLMCIRFYNLMTIFADEQSSFFQTTLSEISPVLKFKFWMIICTHCLCLKSFFCIEHYCCKFCSDLYYYCKQKSLSLSLDLCPLLLLFFMEVPQLTELFCILSRHGNIHSVFCCSLLFFL